MRIGKGTTTVLHIGVLVGSLRVNSLNRRLADTLIGMAPEGVELVLIPIADLPLFNEDLEADFPLSVTTFRDAITAADALLFITPEHNRSISAALKNAIDFATRPFNVLDSKPAAMVGASPGAVGTAVAQTHLRSILPVLGVTVLGQPEMYLAIHENSFGADGSVEPALHARLTAFLDIFIEFSCRTAPVSPRWAHR